MDLRGRRVLISGAGVGIGRGVALAFAAAGARLFLSDVDADQASETASLVCEQGGEADSAVCDVASREAVFELIDRAALALGGLDVVIQNAGVFPRAPLVEASAEIIERTLAVNLTSAFWFAQAAAPALSKAESGGRLIYTSSISGNRTVVANMSHYAASKAGLNGFIRGAAVDLAPLRITVNGVEPGLIAVERHAAWGEALEKTALRLPLGRPGRAEDIAGAMLFLASSAASYVTGQTIVVDGGAMLQDLTSA